MNVAFRRLLAEDVDDVLGLAARSAEAPNWTRNHFAQILRTQDAVMRYAVVACSGQVLAGFAAAVWVRGELAAEMEVIVVEPDHRRRGIGTTFVQMCKAWAVEMGAGALRLEVRTSNVAALALYQHLGFSPTGRRNAYYAGPVEDALLLEAPLLPPSPL